MTAPASLSARLRTLGGVYAKEWLRYQYRLAAGGRAYLAIRNRDERLERAPDFPAYRCLWQWTSTLHAASVIPSLGGRLMRRALADHPIERRTHPASGQDGGADVSFLIGHRGPERVPLLLATLESVAAQQDAAVECIVINQDADHGLQAMLPGWVRHVHLPPSNPDEPYRRSLAFNVGAGHARGRVLVLHDNDMLVPRDYAASLLERVNSGFEVVNLKRFIFYLSSAHTASFLSGAAHLTSDNPESVVQNLEGGGSVAITREGYERIGGMDEAFVGWGGEDNEFWERAQTLRVWPYAYLPIVHLWHAAQPGKQDHDNPALRRLRELAAVPVNERIERLREAAALTRSPPT